MSVCDFFDSEAPYRSSYSPSKSLGFSQTLSFVNRLE